MKFRYKALQRMREPDELDAPTLLAAPRGWVAVMVVLIVMAGAVAWTFLGKLPVTVAAPGLLTRPGGTASVQSPRAGMVVHLLAHSDGNVTAGQPIAEIKDVSGATEQVTTPFAGHVIGLAVSEGQVIGVGATLVTVERTDAPNDRMIAMLFVPADRAVRIAPGDAVDLAVSTAPPSAFGLLRGRIQSIGPYPLTAAALSGLVGGDLAAKTYAGTTAPRLVIVDLIRDRSTKSGFAWSTTKGSPAPLRTQVAVSATISVGSETPFSLMFGH